MRKIAVMLVIVCLFGLCGCVVTKHLTIEQSKKNFETYKKSLQEVADKYGVELTGTVEFNTLNRDDYYTYMDLSIIISDDEKLRIYIENSAIESPTGVESFYIEYTLQNPDSTNQFNVDLFVDLVNCISGRSISVEFCNEFLTAPESEYAAENYGYTKGDDKLIYKYYPLNFFEDWVIGYVLYKENTEKLTFGGLTLQLEE